MLLLELLILDLLCRLLLLGRHNSYFDTSRFRRCLRLGLLIQRPGPNLLEVLLIDGDLVDIEAKF